MHLQPIIRAAVCAALVAALIAGAGWFPTQPVAGQETKQQTLRGAAALDQLKQDGQYESLQAAMNQARFSVSRAEHTPLGRAAWHAPNPAAGYDAYVTEEGVSIAVNDRAIVSLSLHSLGYGAALHAVGPGEVSGDKQTINGANGAQSYEAVARLEGNRFVPAPIDLGPAGDQVFLVLYGTGLRFRQTVSASLGGVDTNVLFAGAVAGFAGLDQINLSLPRALIGRGEMDVLLRVDGVNANPVRIRVR